MTPSLQWSPTKAKETPSPYEVRPAPLDTTPVFQRLGGNQLGLNAWSCIAAMIASAFFYIYPVFSHSHDLLSAIT